MTEEQTAGSDSPAESSGETPSDSSPEAGSGTRSARSPAARPSLGATLAQRWKVVAAVLPALGFALAVARYYRGCEADHQDLINAAWRQVRAASENPGNRNLTANVREPMEFLHREGESFRGLRIENFRLRDAELAGADFAEVSGANADFARARLAGADFAGATLTAPDFTNAGLGEAGFDGAQLPGAIFEDVTALGDAVFHGAILRDASFDRAILAGADLADAEVPGVTFRDAVLSADGAGAPPTLLPKRLQCVDLSHADLAGTDLREKVLVDSSLAGACLAGSQLQGASFTYADITGADFSGADGLTGAAIASACIREGGDPPVLPEGLRWAGRECEPVWEVRRGDSCRIEPRPATGPARPCVAPESSSGQP